MLKNSCTILFFAFLLLIQSSVSVTDNRKNVDQGFDEEETLDLQDNQDHSLYEIAIQKREKELENERLKQVGADKYQSQKNVNKEKQSWIYSNKKQLLKILGIGVSTILIILIGWKLYIMNQNIEKQNFNIREQAKQMENIIDDTDNLVFVSWKDQKEGIIFFDNVAYKQKIEKDLSKQERLIQEIRQLEKEKAQRDQEIEKLRQKGQSYEEEIENLKEQYEQNKIRVLDEGCALGYAAPVLREFK